jgi:hypothetical protein
LIAAGAVTLTLVGPALADQAAVNKCGSTIGKESGKILKLFAQRFLKCYSARHKCSGLYPAGPEREACLDATTDPNQACSCEKLDVDNPNTGTGQALAKLEAKIASKCDPALEPDITDDELLNEDMADPRAKLGYRPRRNCMCGDLVGDEDGDLESFAEVIECIRLLLLKAAASQVGWDADPRAQGEIFSLVLLCEIGMEGDACSPSGAFLTMERALLD